MHVENSFIERGEHVGSSLAEEKEVRRFNSASKANAKPVGTSLRKQFRGDGVSRHSRIERRNAVGFHPNKGGMIEHRIGDCPRPEEWERIDVDVDRQVHLSLSPLDIGDQELRLKIFELCVACDASGANIEGVQISEIAVAVEISRLPDAISVGPHQNDVEPELRLCTERSARHVMTFTRVANEVVEVEIPPRNRCICEERAVDLRTVFENLYCGLTFVIEKFLVFIDYLSGVDPFLCNFPSVRKLEGMGVAPYQILEFRSPPSLTMIELKPLIRLPTERFLVVRKKTGMGERVCRPVEHMIGVFSLLIDRLLIDFGSSAISVP